MNETEDRPIAAIRQAFSELQRRARKAKYPAPGPVDQCRAPKQRAAVQPAMQVSRGGEGQGDRGLALRIDPDLVKALRDLGVDWETQANDLPRAALEDAPAAPLQRVS